MLCITLPPAWGTACRHYFRFRGLVVSSVAAAPGAVPEFAAAGPNLSKPASGWPAAKAAG